MKARNSTNVRFSFTAAALALAIASCAGSGDSGTGGSPGTTGGSGGKGGTTTTSNGGTTTTPTGGTTTPPAGGSTGSGDGVITFAAGKASGAMTGYGWIALGLWDTVDNPTCIAASGEAERKITQPSPCPSCGGKSVWTGGSDKLCVSGAIPKVTKGDAGTDDYDSNWGIQIGLNAGPINACLEAGTPETPTLGKTFTKVAFSINASAVTPGTAAIRGEIHRKGDPEATTYCATILSSTDGTATKINLSVFNTKCWGDPTGVDLKPEDIPNIDKIGVQISSDNVTAYAVKDFCLSKVEFFNE